jgi:LysR family transcriptional activator of nhaA
MLAIGKTDTSRVLRELNMNHLLYFWCVGQAGSISRAAKRLGVSQPSVSEQVRALERRLGTRLLQRTSRGAALTDAGRAAMRYAEEIVGVGADLVRALPLDRESPAMPLRVGTSDAVPKMVVRSLLMPAVSGRGAGPMLVREWRVDLLLAELALHRLDLVVTDSPIAAGSGTQLRSFTAATSAVSLLATPAMARKLRPRFPASLAGTPILLPTVGSSLRASLDRWLAMARIQPRIAIEADDRSLLHHFAQAGLGVVPVPDSIVREVCRQFGLVRFASLRQVQEHYYVVIVARAEEHPALRRIRLALTRSGARRARGASA